MNLRHKRGATLGLVAAVALMLVFVGFCIYWVVQMLGGGQQIADATDAGAITAAKELEAITVDVTKTPGLIGTPVELEGFGVDTTTGKPTAGSATESIYNIYAYNRAVGAAILVCANAEAEGTHSAIANAATTVTNLQAIGTYLADTLNSSLASGSKVFDKFQTTAYSNNVNMMGPSKNTVANLQSMKPGWVGSTDLAGNHSGKANVYFHSATSQSFIATHLPSMATGGVVSNTAATYATPTELPGAEAKQPFVPGYQKIDYTKGIGGGLPIPGADFYAVAVNPDQFPHLIDIGRFASGANAPDGKSIGKTSVPFNSVQGTTQTEETSKTNMFASALAAAVIGTGNNMYPITLVHGFVLLSNDHSYKYNAVQAGDTMVPSALDESPPTGGDNIFNAELYEDTSAGGGGQIDTYVSTSPSLNDVGNQVFGVEAGPTLMNATNGGTAADSAMGNLANQMAVWWEPYLNSNTAQHPNTYSGPNVPNVDKYGKDPNMDPTGGINGWNPAWGGTPSLISTNYFVINNNLWQQNDNARVAPTGSAGSGVQNIVPATADQMASIVGSDVACHDNVYTGTPPTACTNNGTNANHLQNFQNSYGDTLPTGSTVTGDGGATGGLTSLEYLKGLVITAYVEMVQSTGVKSNYKVTIPSAQFTFPAVKSGSHIYSRAISGTNAAAYAQPSNATTVEFGKAGNPYALLNQIVDGSDYAPTAANSSSCPGNISLSTASPLWTSSASIQGQLLQRVQEIDPAYTAVQLVPLLQAANTIDLGWSDVIYWDTTKNAINIQVYNPSNAATLAAFPAWLQTRLTAITAATSPTAYLDGTQTPLCGDQAFVAAGNKVKQKNIIDAEAGVNGNAKGDYYLHDAPFQQEGGNIETQDGVVWTANSGKDGLLGQLLFQQNTNGGGSAGVGSALFYAPN